MNTSTDLPGRGAGATTTTNVLSLVDVLRILRDRRHIGVGVIVAMVALGVAAAFHIGPRYEKLVSIAIANVGDEMVVERGILQETLRSSLILDPRDIGLPGGIGETRVADGVAQFTVTGASEADVRALVDAAVQRVVALQEPHFEHALSMRRELVELLESQVRVLRQSIHMITDEAGALTGEALEAGDGTVLVQLVNTERQLKSLRSEIDSPETYPATVIESPGPTASYRWPVVIILIASSLGGVLAFFTPLLVEAASRIRSELVAERE